jgi:hypothetical protein
MRAAVEALMAQCLTKEDWQYIEYAVRERFNRARPKPSEGQPSKEFLEQEKRITDFLFRKAFPP